MKRIAIVMFALLLGSNVLARDVSELSSPILMLTPVVKKHADVLQLNADQRRVLKEWLATAPGKRMAVEDEAVRIRAALRQASIDGAPEPERLALAQQLGELETQMLKMRSDCINHWRQTLSSEQYAKALELAGVK